MNKILATTLTAISLTAALGSTAFSHERVDSINHLFSMQQLTDYCSQNGIAGNTRIKISLPNAPSIYGTIICAIED